MTRTALATRAARRALDVALILLIGAVLVLLGLSRGLPIATHGTTLVVAGASMEPGIPRGSLVHAVPVDATSLRVGDIVSLRTGPGRAVFTHRIVRLATLADGLYIETKGDANAEPDPALVPASDVIGRVELSLPAVGFAVAMLGSIQGILLMLSVAAVLLAAAWLLESIEDEQRETLRRRAGGVVAAVTGDTPTHTGVPA